MPNDEDEQTWLERLREIFEEKGYDWSKLHIAYDEPGMTMNIGPLLYGSQEMGAENEPGYGFELPENTVLSKVEIKSMTKIPDGKNKLTLMFYPKMCPKECIYDADKNVNKYSKNDTREYDIPPMVMTEGQRPKDYLMRREDMKVWIIRPFSIDTLKIHVKVKLYLETIIL